MMGKGNKQRGNLETKKPKADKKVALVTRPSSDPRLTLQSRVQSRRQNSRRGKRNSTCEFRRRCPAGERLPG